MNEILQHVSPSSLEMYDRCGIQWSFRYVLGKKVPPSGALVRGRAFHQAEEKNFKQKIETQKDLPLEEVEAAFSDAYDLEIQDATLSKDENAGTLKDEGIGGLQVYHQNIASTVQPKLVEASFTATVADYPFAVRLDLVDDQNALRDTKTSSKSPVATQADLSPQLTAYDLTYRQVFGQAPTSLKLDYAVLTKTPKTVTLIAKPRTEEVLKVYEEETALKIDAIRKGVFIPAPADSWACSEKYCGYYSICTFGARRKNR